MKIEIKPNSIEMLKNKFNKIKCVARDIGDRVNEINSSLGIEIREDINISNKIQDIRRSLEEISFDSGRYAEFLSNTVHEYTSQEKNLKCLADQVYSSTIGLGQKDILLSSNRDNFLFDVEKSSLKEDQNIIMSEKDIKFCKLPQRDLITKGSIKASVLSNGKNICIRSWTV